MRKKDPDESARDMRYRRVTCGIILAGLMSMQRGVGAQEASPLRLLQAVPLPNVRGRIDHMAVDVKGGRLFIGALGNNTVEVVDLRAGDRIRTIAGFHEPQGLAFVPEFNKLFVANAKNGVCDILDGASFKPLGEVNFEDDADNIRYDAKTGRVYVGYGEGAIGVVSAATGQQAGAIRLPGHPESFQLEQSSARIFVNVPSAQQVIVADRRKGAVIASWPVPGARSNYPMALDEDSHRLFVGVRRPAKLLVFDTQSGKVTAELPSPGDADDIFYDGARGRIYISGGEGYIGVLQRSDPDHYRLAGKVSTAAGARTSVLVAEFGRLYVAVPSRGSQRAELRVFATQQ